MSESQSGAERIVRGNQAGEMELRQLSPDEADAYYGLLHDSAQHTDWGGEGPTYAAHYPDPEAVRNDIANPPQQDEIPFGIWLRTDTDFTFIGSVKLWLTTPGGSEYETASWVAFTHKGHNFAAQARAIIIRYTFDELDASQLVSFVTVGNIASARSLTHSGYTHVDTDPVRNEWRYVITRADYDNAKDRYA